MKLSLGKEQLAGCGISLLCLELSSSVHSLLLTEPYRLASVMCCLYEQVRKSIFRFLLSFHVTNANNLAVEK